MGGFILKVKSRIVNNENDTILSNSILPFTERNQRIYKTINSESFTLHLFTKLNYEVNNYIEYADNFIACTGTLFYNGKINKEALHDLYLDFESKKNIENGIAGNYCVLIFYNNQLYLFRDYFGYYPVYFNKETGIYSSSFLSIFYSLRKTTVAQQELYEYIFTGYFYHNNTLIKEIQFIESQYIHNIFNNTKERRIIKPKYNLADYSFNKAVLQVKEDLTERVKVLKSNFDNGIASALSGGYDSRLLLAMFRNQSTIPYLYVYGNNESADVKIAKEIADSEKLALQVIDKSVLVDFSKQEFVGHIRKMHFFYDGLMNFGIFDNGINFKTKDERSRKADILINGAGGEMYRECWNLPNKKMKITDIYKSKYDIDNYSFCGSAFNKTDFIINFNSKIKQILDIDRDYITRYELEQLLPMLRGKLAYHNHINNQIFSHALLFYIDPKLAADSYTIPYKYKLYGRFQAELIKSFDLQLSKYNSVYGINFYDSVPLKYRIKKKVYHYINPQLRAKLKYQRKRKRLNVQEYLINKGFESFGKDDNIIDPYIDLKNAYSNTILSRAYTVELLLRKIFI